MHDEGLIEQMAGAEARPVSMLAVELEAAGLRNAVAAMESMALLQDAQIERLTRERDDAVAVLREALDWLRVLRPKVAFCTNTRTLDRLSTFLERWELRYRDG